MKPIAVFASCFCLLSLIGGCSHRVVSADDEGMRIKHGDTSLIGPRPNGGLPRPLPEPNPPPPRVGLADDGEWVSKLRIPPHPIQVAFADPIDADPSPDKPPQPVEVVVNVEPPELGYYLPAKCTNVVDGDTIDVEVKKIIRIRLNVWCPEKFGPTKEAGLRAKYAMEKLAKDQPGVVIIPWKDAMKDELTLDRVLGRFIVNGTDVGKEMIRKKLGAATKAEMEEMFPVEK